MQSTEVPPARGDDCFSTHTHTLTLSSHTHTHASTLTHNSCGAILPAVPGSCCPWWSEAHTPTLQTSILRSAHQGQGHSFRGPEVPWERSCPLADDRRGHAAHQACSPVPVWPRRKPREAGYWRRWHGPSSTGQIHIVLSAVTEAMQVAVPSAA